MTVLKSPCFFWVAVVLLLAVFFGCLVMNGSVAVAMGMQTLLSALLILSCIGLFWWVQRKKLALSAGGGTLWLVLLLSCLFNLMGNYVLYQHPVCLPVSILTTMGTICLLWSLLKRFSWIFWIPFLLFEMMQLAVFLEFGSVVSSVLVLSEVCDASWSDVQTYMTLSNGLMLLLALALACLVSWLAGRCVRRIGRAALALNGVGCLLAAYLLAWNLVPVALKKSYLGMWPLYEVKAIASNFAEARALNDELINYVKCLPSPAEQESSLKTVGAGQGVVLVVHVGESVRADRMSLNGYLNRGRSTTPWLDSQKGSTLINFSNCISAASTTCAAQIAILTDARRDPRVKNEPGMQARTGSVLDLFAVNNFSLYSFLGAPASMTGKYDRVATLLTSRSQGRYLASGLSHTVLRHVESVLEENPYQNLVFYVQNEGSHSPFFAWTDDYAPFRPSRGGWDNPAGRAEEVNNAYDNTIYYTDAYISKLAGMLRGRPYIYLYISDHGEYSGQDGYWYRTSMLDKEGVYHSSAASRVGMFIIMSPEMKALHPHFAEAEKNLRANADMTVGHEHIFHTLIGIFGMSTPHYDARLDLSSENPQPYTGPQPQLPPQPDSYPASLHGGS